MENLTSLFATWTTTPGAKLLGGVVVVSSVTATGVCATRMLRPRYCAVPYPSRTQNQISRAVQRFLVERTVQRHDFEWFVGHSLIESQPKRLTDNGHAKSGAIRDAARRLITSTISANGWRKVEISPGEYTKDCEFADHQHYAVSDLHRKLSYDSDGKGDVVVGIDVDYYIEDIDRYLALLKPMIFHTFNPIEVAGVDGDAPFRIQNNEVVYDVGGGGQWRHKVWDWCNYGEFIYGVDTLHWIPWLLSYLGFEKIVYHKLHHARPWADCPNRVLVWTIPMFSHWRFKYMFQDLQCRRLARVNYQDDTRPGWNRLVHTSNGETNISIGRENEDAHFNLLKSDYDVLMGLNSQQSVTTRMIGMGYKEPAELALFGQYYGKSQPNMGTPDRIAQPAALVHWPLAMEADVPETTTRVYSSPLVNVPNLVPMSKRWEVLSESIEQRVTFYANNKTPGKQIASFAEEFVALVTEQACVEPYTPEEAREELTKPSQQLAARQIWETLDAPHRLLIECFVKNEPTSKNGRIISSFADARFLLMFSRFTLAFRNNVLHSERNAHWFMPGLTPNQLADKVCNYVSSVWKPCEGDFSNMDGTVSTWLQRHVMNAAYFRGFDSRLHKELRTYTDMLIKCPARAKKFGFKYEAGCGVKSGSPTTCDLNTILCAFTMYIAIRRTNPMLTTEEAFQQIGLAFGDDSLFDAQYSKHWEKAVRELGMKLKVDICAPTTGVTFLARVFPDPLRTRTSFQDPVRTWKKLHITMRDPNVPLDEAANDRLDGYLQMDKHTPVTSNYCHMIKRCYKLNSTQEGKRATRKDRLREKAYWAVGDGSWPQDPADSELMLNCISARSGIDLTSLTHCMSQLDQLQDPWSIVPLEVESNYANTVLPCGTETEVDTRLFQQQRDVNHVRAGPSRSSESDREPSAGTRETDPGRRNSGGRQSGKVNNRPRQLCGSCSNQTADRILPLRQQTQRPPNVRPNQRPRQQTPTSGSPSPSLHRPRPAQAGRAQRPQASS
nr:MAG: RNA-dependent RNA polymerase [Riboviria sp.]